jgi:hypothetical protein
MKNARPEGVGTGGLQVGTCGYGTASDRPKHLTIACGARRAFLSGDMVPEVLTAAGIALVVDEFGDVVIPVGAAGLVAQVAQRLGYRAITTTAGTR